MGCQWPRAATGRGTRLDDKQMIAQVMAGCSNHRQATWLNQKQVMADVA